MNLNNWKTGAAGFAVILAIAFHGGTSWADESTTLRATGADADARGTVVLEVSGSIDCDRLMRINTLGLEPDSLYSVWIVEKKTGKTVPAGLTDRNYFTTDSAGTGSYTWFTWVRNLYWNTLVITYHPDGKGDGTTVTEGAPAVLSARITP